MLSQVNNWVYFYSMLKKIASLNICLLAKFVLEDGF